MSDAPHPTAIVCPACGAECPHTLLACPQCHHLFYADDLKRLAEEAGQATREGDLTAAQAAWREALVLLPSDSRQYQTITARLVELGRQVDQAETSVGAPQPGSSEGEHKSGWSGGAGAAGVGTLALLVWKFKFLAVMVLTKGKLLLLGLTKASTLFSMFLSLGVYWTAFGWWFALGVVLSIYVHEMGHVAALRRYGIKADAPMFIPGLGAMIRVRQTLPDARADARVGLAGPIWGLGGAVITYAASLATGSMALAAIARFAAWINLFNLMPIWQLDGSRGFRAMSRPQRWFAALALAVMWSATSEGLLLLLSIVAAFNATTQKPASEPDREITFQYVFLVVVLSTMTMIPVFPAG
jgi:Zn-dependent protease